MSQSFAGVPPEWREHYTKVYEAGLQDLERRHGPRQAAYRSPPHVVAAHEAGHVLVGHLNGIKPIHADIEFNDEAGREGQTRYAPWTLSLTDETPDTEFERLGQLWFAGGLGEWVLLRNSDPFTSLDEQAMVGTLSAWLSRRSGEDINSIFKRIANQTEALLEKHNSTLWAVYHPLLVQRTLNGPQLQAILSTL